MNTSMAPWGASQGGGGTGGGGVSYTTSGTSPFLPKYDGSGFVDSELSDDGTDLTFGSTVVAARGIYFNSHATSKNALKSLTSTQMGLEIFASRVQVWTSSYVGIEQPLRVTGLAAGDIGFEVELASGHTGNAIEVNAFGGSGGDLFVVKGNGDVNISGTLLFDNSLSPSLPRISTYNTNSGLGAKSGANVVLFSPNDIVFQDGADETFRFHQENANGGTLDMKEVPSFHASTAAFGQWAVLDDVPNNPYFIDDAGNDFPLLFSKQNSQSAAYTTTMADKNGHIFHPTADTTARTWTIDSNANVPYPIGTHIEFINENGAGVITIAITTDTLRLAGAGTTGSRTLAANGTAVAVKVTSTLWYISGTGLS